MSYAEDMGYYEPDDEQTGIARECEWINGIHTDNKGVEHKITEMSDFHLLNTINFFKDYDTEPLIKEAKRRKILK
jgi:hypothetical protein